MGTFQLLGWTIGRIRGRMAGAALAIGILAFGASAGRGDAAEDPSTERPVALEPSRAGQNARERELQKKIDDLEFAYLLAAERVKTLEHFLNAPSDEPAGPHIPDVSPMLDFPDLADASPEMRAAMQRPIEVSFDQTPLSKVVEKISNAIDEAIVVDWTALAHLEITPDRPVTLKLAHAVPALEALTLAVRQLSEETHVEFKDRLACITQAPSTVLRTYDVSDLAAPQGAVKDEAALERRMDHLANIVKDVVDPMSWRENGGAGSAFAFGSTLVITTSLHDHRQVRNLLDRLRHPSPKG